MARLVAGIAVAALALAVPAGGAREPRTATLIAAGDVASCTSRADEATAALLDRFRGVVAVLGDSVYEHGTDEEYARCYHPTWGRARSRTRPAVGNHEYGVDGAAGYFRYFGARAGTPGRGWYTYRLGAWRVLVLNSNCGRIGGCHRGSAQERWLRAVLRTNRTRCTLAYWHHPRFSSGPHGNENAVEPFWRALYAYGADVVLAGHDHLYERFAQQTPEGRPDRRRGIRQFVVGTGGRSLYEVEHPRPNSEARSDYSFGVLVLTLAPASYRWRFVSVDGSFSDAGSDRCHA